MEGSGEAAGGRGRSCVAGGGSGMGDGARNADGSRVCARARNPALQLHCHECLTLLGSPAPGGRV